MLATRLGAAAAERLLAGQHGVLVGLIHNAIAATPLDVVVGSKKALDVELLELARVLAK
jgi:6-phosphofructokinase